MLRTVWILCGLLAAAAPRVIAQGPAPLGISASAMHQSDSAPVIAPAYQRTTTGHRALGFAIGAVLGAALGVGIGLIATLGEPGHHVLLHYAIAFGAIVGTIAMLTAK